MQDVLEPCEVSPDCLECPLSQCRFDDERWYTALRKSGQRARLLMFLREGYSAEDAALAFGLQLRTVRSRLYTVDGDRRFTIEDLSYAAERFGLATDLICPVTRVCANCEADISKRHRSAKRCVDCARRSRAMSVACHVEVAA